MIVSERVYIYPYQPPSETRPLAVAGGQVSLKIEERIAKLVGESVSCFKNFILSFCMYPLSRIRDIVLRLRIWSPCESNFPQAPARSGGPVEGWLVFVIVTPSMVSATS